MAACTKLDPPINSQNWISCARLDHAFYLSKYGNLISSYLISWCIALLPWLLGALPSTLTLLAICNLLFLQPAPALSGGVVMDSVSHTPGVVMVGGPQTALMAVMNWTVVSILNWGYCTCLVGTHQMVLQEKFSTSPAVLADLSTQSWLLYSCLDYLVNLMLLATISLFLQHVPALSGGAVMDTASHLTNAVMEIQSAVMAVMNWTAVSYCSM